MNATVIKLLLFSGREKRLIFSQMLAAKLLHKRFRASARPPAQAPSHFIGREDCVQLWCENTAVLGDFVQD